MSDPVNVARAREKVAKHPSQTPLFLTNDPDDGWTRDREAFDAFMQAHKNAPENENENAHATDNGRASAPPPPSPCHPSRRPPIPAALRNAVWSRELPPGVRETGTLPCACCDRSVSWQDFECGHVRSFADGGPTDITNLRVLCHTCNRSMGRRDLAEFKAAFFGIPGLPDGVGIECT